MYDLILAGLAVVCLVAFWAASLHQRVNILSSDALLFIGYTAGGLFWLLMAPSLYHDAHSPLESIAAIMAFPVAIYLWRFSYRHPNNTLLTERIPLASAITGTVYGAVSLFPTVDRVLINSLTVVTTRFSRFFVSHPITTTTGPNGYQSGILFPEAAGGPLMTHIDFACTGIGSLILFVAIVSILDKSIPWKITVGVGGIICISIANIVRTTFITVAFGEQLFQILIPYVLTIWSATDPRLVSFFVADKVLGQTFSGIFLLVISYGLLSTSPTLIEDMWNLKKSSSSVFNRS